MSSSLSLLERFWAKVDTSGDPGACWLWRGAHTAGYGIFGLGKPHGRLVNEYAHRLAYVLKHRMPLPSGTRMTIDHICRERSCVNPAHLELVSQRENFLRGVHRSAETLRRQMCSRGHAWQTEMYRRPNGSGYCRACQYETQRRCRGYVERRGRYRVGTPPVLC